MKFSHIFMLAAAMLFAFASCAKKDNDELGHHHDHAHEHEHNSHEGHNHHDDIDESPDAITLSPEAAELFGLSVEPASLKPLNTVVKAAATIETSAAGTAVVTAPSSGIVALAPGINVGTEVKAGTALASVKADVLTGGDANRIARIDLEAAKAEFERIESLYADRLVTLAEYNAAKAAYERAKAAYSPNAASGRAVAPISGIITELVALPGQFVEAGSPIARIADASSLVLRAMVPVKDYRAVASARDARIVFADGSPAVMVSELNGRRLDTNSSAGSFSGYVPVTFALINDGSIIPGQAVEVYILGDSDRQAISLPVSAISEQQGAFFVYQQLDEDCYRRIPVKTGASDGTYIEITEGLQGGENIVVNGVTAVKLAQSSGAVPEGHSHSH